MAALKRFGLDVEFGSNTADADIVYGHRLDFSNASKNETPAQILGRTIPLQIECEEPLEPGNLNSGMLALSLVNEQIGVVLRGVETGGGVRRTYAFRVPAEWARTCVLNIIEKASVGLTMQTEPGGRQYSQVGYAKPDADGFVTIKVGPLTVVVYKTQVWHQKMPGEAPM